MEGLSCAQPSYAAAAGLLIMGWWSVFGAHACWQQRVCVCQLGCGLSTLCVSQLACHAGVGQLSEAWCSQGVCLAAP